MLDLIEDGPRLFLLAGLDGLREAVDRHGFYPLMFVALPWQRSTLTDSKASRFLVALDFRNERSGNSEAVPTCERLSDRSSIVRLTRRLFWRPVGRALTGITACPFRA